LGSRLYVFGRKNESRRWSSTTKRVARGLNIGTRLLEPAFTLTDKPGQRCYLEAMTQRNLGWYRGLGFEVGEAGRASFSADRLTGP
jgi:ribosomal protein S18 acetylase RimI-like enzyme